MNKILKTLGALLLCASGAASAYSVTYKANDLVDAVAGEDLWEYRYSFSGAINAFDTVQIIFDSGNYSGLDGDATVGDWSITITQPDSGLGADGLYDALATVSPISVADEFVVRFVWLSGPAKPGSQPFRVLDGDFNEIETGRTRASGTPVPEPGSIALLLMGGVALMGVSRRRRVSKR